MKITYIKLKGLQVDVVIYILNGQIGVQLNANCSKYTIAHLDRYLYTSKLYIVK